MAQDRLSFSATEKNNMVILALKYVSLAEWALNISEKEKDIKLRHGSPKVSATETVDYFFSVVYKFRPEWWEEVKEMETTKAVEVIANKLEMDVSHGGAKDPSGGGDPGGVGQ